VSARCLGTQQYCSRGWRGPGHEREVGKWNSSGVCVCLCWLPKAWCLLLLALTYTHTTFNTRVCVFIPSVTFPPPLLISVSDSFSFRFLVFVFVRLCTISDNFHGPLDWLTFVSVTTFVPESVVLGFYVVQSD
jgi:hypothetical protein